MKNGKKFLKAAERAQKLGKMKNALSFAKAAARAMKKANAVGNAIKKWAENPKIFFDFSKIRCNFTENSQASRTKATNDEAVV